MSCSSKSLYDTLPYSRVIYLRDGGIVGEHRMQDYEADDLAKRRESLQNFLNEMGW